jgi:hypothetical protein
MAVSRLLRIAQGVGRGWWLVGALLIVWTCLLWNAFLASQIHEPLRLASFQVSGLPQPIRAPSADRFLLDDTDSHYWLVNVRRMLLEGRWRIRETDSDNAPFGREMHWSSIPAWWLIGIYLLISAIHPGSLTTNLSWAAYFAGPILECAFLMWVTLTTERRFGSRAAFTILCGLAAYRNLTMAFRPAVTDHHGWHIITAVGTLLGMLCASFSFLPGRARNGLQPARDRLKPVLLNRRIVRGWLMVSGFFAGSGLALGAPGAVLVLGTMGTAAGLMLLIARIWPGDRSAVPYPEGWTWWSGSAAITSLLFYLVEYIPGHLSMQLATNHPCYAITCLSAGLILRNLAGGHWRTRGIWPVTWLAGVLGISLVPALIIFGPDSWFILKEGYVARMHHEISEFQSYLSRPGMLTLPESVVRWGVTFLAAAMTLRLFIQRSLDRFEQSLLLAALLMTGLLTATALIQARWTNQASVSGAILLLAGFTILERKKAFLTRTLVLISVVALFAFNIGERIVLYQNLIQNKAAPSNLIQPLADREIANALCQFSSNDKPIVVCGLGQTPLLNLYGGIRGVGSFYWENASGMRDWADFLGATSFEVAEGLAKHRRIDWVLLPDRDDSAKMAVRIRNANPGGADSTVADRLRLHPADLPSWIRPFGMATVSFGPKVSVTFHVFRIAPVEPAGRE